MPSGLYGQVDVYLLYETQEKGRDGSVLCKQLGVARSATFSIEPDRGLVESIRDLEKATMEALDQMNRSLFADCLQSAWKKHQAKNRPAARAGAALSDSEF